MKLILRYPLFLSSILLYVLGIISLSNVTKFIQACTNISSIFRIDIIIYIFISLSLLTILLIAILSLMKGTEKVMDYLNAISVSIFLVFILLYIIIWCELYSASNVTIVDTNEVLVLTNTLPILLHCIIAQGVVIMVSLTNCGNIENQRNGNVGDMKIEEQEESKILINEINNLKAKLKMRELEEEYILLRSKLDKKDTEKTK